MIGGGISADYFGEKMIHGVNHRPTVANLFSYGVVGVRSDNDFMYSHFQNHTNENPDFPYHDYIDAKGYIKKKEYATYMKNHYQLDLQSVQNNLPYNTGNVFFKTVSSPDKKP